MHWTEVAQALSSIGALLATIFGFSYVYRQIALVRRSLLAQANAVLSDQSLAILSFIADHPETYDYLYHNKVLQPGDPNTVVVQCACEMVANYCDMAMSMLADLHPSVADRWRRFITDTATCSPAFRTHLSHHRLWYSDDLLALI